MHSWDPNLHITCGIQGCPRVYTSYRSYRRHIIKEHPEFTEGAEEHNSLSGTCDLDIPEELHLSPCDSPSPSGTGTLPAHSAALFILKAKEQRVSQRALDEDFHEICEIQGNALRDSNVLMACSVNQLSLILLTKSSNTVPVYLLSMVFI